MSGGKRLLIIHYYFPPVHMVSSVRIFHFYQESLRHFEGVSVLSSTNRHRFRQDETLETGCQDVTDVPAYDLRRFTLSRREGNAPHLSSAQRARPWIQLLQRLLNSFPLNVIIGDGGAYYIWKGYRAGKRLVEERGITHLFSSYRPYSDHLIAYLLKRRYPQLFWIADFRDLQVDPVLRNTLCPRFQQACNRYLLSRADVLSTVSQGLKAQLEQVHPRVVVLRNGIGEVPVQKMPSLSKFTVVYTGSLYGGRRNPAPIFQAVSQLVAQKQIPAYDIQLVYAGAEAAVWRNLAISAGLMEVSKEVGYLPRAEALQWQFSAHLNLLLTWSSEESKGVLSGKLFEYLATGCPIVAMVEGPDDAELRQLVGKGPVGSAVFFSQPEYDIDALAQCLLGHYTTWKDGKWRRQQVPAVYQWDKIMNDFMKAIG